MSPALINMLALRRSRLRLAGITAGICLGTAIFLLLAGTFLGIRERDARAAWLDPSGPVVASGSVAVPGQILAVDGTDHFLGRDISLLAVGSDDPGAQIDRLGRIPEPGRSLVSPALARLMVHNPPNLLADRFGVVAGTVPDSLLPGPDSLVAVIGADATQLRASGNSRAITADSGAPSSLSAPLRTIIAIGAIGVLMPVALLVAIVTELGLAQRQEDLATLRLLGAPPAIVRRLAVFEAVVTASLGSAAGAVLAILARPLAARIRAAGSRFFPSDLSLPALAYVIVCIGLVAVLAVVAALRARRVQIGPLGITRQSTEMHPRAVRLIPVAVGLCVFPLLAWAIRSNRIAGGGLASAIMIGGFLLISLGIVSAGPYLIFVVARFATRRARRADGLIAAGRIQTRPRAAFRSVSGLVIAVFMVSVFAGAASAGAPAPARAGAGLMPLDAVIVPVDQAKMAPQSTIAPGVVGAIELSQAPDGRIVAPGADATRLGFAAQPGQYFSFELEAYLSAAASEAAQASAWQGDRAALKLAAIVVRTDGSAQSIERARTALVMGQFSFTSPVTRAEAVDAARSATIRQLYSLAYAGVFAAIAIAGLALAIAAAAAVVDRRRVLGMLRLIGMPGGQLRRIVTYEAALPLIAVLGISAVLGLAVACFIVLSLSSASPGIPATEYFLALAAGSVCAIGAVAASQSAIRAGSAMSATRFE